MALGGLTSGILLWVPVRLAQVVCGKGTRVGCTPRTACPFGGLDLARAVVSTKKSGSTNVKISFS